MATLPKPDDHPAIACEDRTDRPARLGLAMLGMACFCVWSHAWQDWQHLIYDVPASFAAFAFIAEWLVHGLRGRTGKCWRVRLGLILAMTAVTAGRAFLGWNISGHLSCVLAVAVVQTFTAGLPAWERLGYWLPLPIVLWIRWTAFDAGDHGQTYAAAVFGILAPVPVILCERLIAQRPAHD